MEVITLYLYAFHQARDKGMNFPKKLFLVHESSYSEEEFFSQIKNCYDELKKTSMKINPFLKTLLKTKGIRPIMAEDIVMLMIEKYGYQGIENKHKFKAWIEDTHLIKDTHGNTFMTILEEDVSKRWIENYL